jgi:hypothetical protein
MDLISHMVYVHPRLRKVIATALFLEHRAAIKVDLRNAVKTWEDYAKPFSGAKGLINKVVVVVEGFHAPTLFGMAELARLFAECPLIKRIDLNPLHAATRKLRMPPGPLEHVLIHAKHPPKGTKPRDPKDKIYLFCKMIAELGRSLRYQSASRGQVRMQMYELALKEYSQGSNEANHEILRRTVVGAQWNKDNYGDWMAPQVPQELVGSLAHWLRNTR